MESRAPLHALIERVVPRLKYPHLFLVLLVLFLVDVFIPDPIPFVDELVLALLTFLLGSWRTRREAQPDEESSPGSAIDGPQPSPEEIDPAESQES